ncbi:MAG: LysR family transcriptional regulator [Vulcanimicrobiaceae bacterium]
MGTDVAALDPRELNVGHLMTLSLVARYGSFTRAADALGISQPSVSQQIRELERVCDVPLVLLRGRTLVMTPLGERLAQAGHRIILERERAWRAVGEHRSGRAGRILVGASMTTGAYVLPARIAEFLWRYPDVAVDVRIGNTADIAQMVVDDLVDFGVVEGVLDRAELRVEAFAIDRMCCITRPGRRHASSQALTPLDVAQEALLVREDGSATREVVLKALADRGFAFERVMMFGTIEAIKAAVREGLGIAWLSCEAVKMELDAGVLERLDFVDGFTIERPLSTIRRRDTAPTPAADALMRMIGA